MELLNRLLYKLRLKTPPRSPMKKGELLPPFVKEALETEKLDTSSVIFSMKTDMCDAEEYGEVYIFFDEKGIYTAQFEEKLKTKKDNKKTEFKPGLLKLSALPIDEIDEIFTEQYLATGQLTYTYKNEYYSLGYFSIRFLETADKFAKIFNAFKQNKDYGQHLRNDTGNSCQKCGAPIPKGLKYCKNCVDNKATTTRLFSLFGDVKWKMLLMIALVLLSSAINLIIPKFSTQKLYDEVLNPGNTLGYDSLLKGLISIVLTMAALKITQQLFTILHHYITAGVLPEVVYSIKSKIFKAMQRLSVGFYTHKQTGSLMDRIIADSNNIYWFFVHGFPYFIGNAITVAGIILIMLFTSVKLTLSVLAAGVLVIIFYPLFSRKFKTLYHHAWVQRSKLISKVSDNINGHRIIKAFSKEADELNRFEKINSGFLKAELQAENMEATLSPLLSFIVYIISAIILGFGGILCIVYKEITIGELLTFVIYLQMLQPTLSFLSQATSRWARCLDSAQRVFEIMDTEPEVKDKDDPIILDELKGSIELQELQFEYEPAQAVIKKLSLKIEAGEMLGIVGKTGAGKTTISNLIARLYDPKEGVVKIDGIDVKELSSKQLRQNIGIVSQDIFLFMGTIADNIRYAKPDATMEEVIAAAKAASAHSFIMQLPDGYETRVGSSGQGLSGGERQRISIARTIIQNPKILILDEATAAMDTETERNIQNSLTKLKEGRTTIAIAHRISTLRDADKLAVIDNGECIEFGSYEELMAKKSAYYIMFKLQEEALRFIGLDEDSSDETDEKEQEYHD